MIIIYITSSEALPLSSDFLFPTTHVSLTESIQSSTLDLRRNITVLLLHNNIVVTNIINIGFQSSVVKSHQTKVVTLTKYSQHKQQNGTISIQSMPLEWKCVSKSQKLLGFFK